MKKICAGVLCIWLMICLVSCTNDDHGKPDFVYYFAVDRTDDNKILMYSVIKKDTKASEKNENTTFVEKIQGADADEVFSIFFENHKNIYTGTVKEYAVGEKMGEVGLEDFKVYLTNSSKLPAKRKTVTVKDINLYIDEKIKGEI